MNQTRGKKAKGNAVILPRQEWDFSKVPTDELEACYFYEFAREFIRNSSVFREKVQEIGRSWNAPKGGGKSRGWLGLALNFSNSASKSRNPLLGSIYFPELVETPWQQLGDLDEPWKAYFMDIAKKWEHPSNAHPFAASLKLELERDRAKSEESWEKWAFVERHWHKTSKSHDLGWFSIDWDYRDEVLKAAFARFLEEGRPTGTGTRDDRGKIRRFTDLKHLGAKRLLDSGLTAAQAHEKTGLFGADRSWYTARSKAKDLLEEMFAEEI